MPAVADAAAVERGKKREVALEKKGDSILGLSLGRSLKLTGSTVAAAPAAAPEEASGQLVVRPPSAELTERIAQKYEKQVANCEKKRIERLQPLDKQRAVKLDQLTTARAVKSDLDAVLRKVVGDIAVGGQEYDKLVAGASFQQNMQFLVEHAKTGQFVEQYGGEGKYDGEFQYGMRHGRGKHEFRGEIYEGDWKWDQRDGQGTLTCKDGSTMQGAWQGGKTHGIVTMTDTKGTVTYEGEIKCGKRDGLGRQLFESGDMYDGGWKDGRLHDRGVYYFTNGDKLYGMWSEGKYDGAAVFHYADGSISRRFYKQGLLMTVQDYQPGSQKFGRDLSRESMQERHRLR